MGTHARDRLRQTGGLPPPAIPRICIGTSGWNYDHWKGVFYPETCKKNKWLEFYANAFSTLEVNATFYRHMKQSTFEKWRRTTPDGFLWSVKANRFITHIRRLQDVADALERFFGSVRALEEKLGVVLFQLPPSLVFDRAVFDSFCALLPEGHRCSLEARHESWTSDEALSLMEKNNIAWCISDTAGKYPYREAVTADFTYIRLHGSRKLYASDYTPDELASWAAKIRAFGRDTYVYFDNDFMGYAPKNASELRDLLGMEARAGR